MVGLADSAGRILCEPILALVNVPICRVAAMDGYALAGNPVRALPFSLAVVGTALAGHAASVGVDATSTVRIMTGAVLPTGADSVVMQEDVQVLEGRVQFSHAVVTGQNVRWPGEDLAVGDIAVAARRRLNAADVQRAASLGWTTLQVRRRLKVALFSSGDEVRPIGAPLAENMVYDSNRQFLIAALKDLDVSVLDLGIVADHQAPIAAALEHASQTADLLITTGGASRGDADIVSQLLERLGHTVFAGVAMKPGRPTRLTLLKRSPAPGPLAPDLAVLSLPGTPSAMLTAFHVFATEAIDLMQGIGGTARRFSARLDGSLMGHASRTEYVPARLTYDSDGAIVTAPIRRGASAAGVFDASIDALVELPAGIYQKRPGDAVAVMLL